MKKLTLMFVLMTAMAVFASWTTILVTATPKYAKETGKKCTDCHVKIPKKGEDPNLTNLGKAFQKNDHKLPK